MCSLLSRSNIRKIIQRLNHRYLSKITEPLSAEPKQKLEFVTEEIIHEAVEKSNLPSIETPKSKLHIFEVSETKIEEKKTEEILLSFEEIPGPLLLKLWEKYWKFVPIIGTQLVYSLLINRFTQGKLRWNKNFVPMKFLFQKYGPVVRINGPMLGDIVMIHRPEHIAKILSQEEEKSARSGIDILDHYRINYRKSLFPGPFSTQSNEWTETKVNLEKSLMGQLSKYFHPLDIICDEFTERIKKIRNRQDEVPENFSNELLRWGLECFSVFMLDKRFNSIYSSDTSEIVEAVEKAHLYLSKCESGFQFWRIFETPYSKKLFEACDVIDDFINKEIREVQSRPSTNPEDDSPFIEKLLKRLKMNPEEISSLLMDMIILGVQATTSSQAFLLYFLAKNPRVQRKVNEEICSILPTKDSNLDEEKIEKMTYLKACIRETLRLRPAFPCISRVAQKTISIHGYKIPKGTYLIMANEISSQREENFDDPGKFLPERWLEEENENIWQNFSSLPFGYGLRACLGKRIAETKIMLLTTKLIREFRIEYDYANIESKNMIVNVPNRPLKFRFVDRN